jgi:hypothetical protein
MGGKYRLVGDDPGAGIIHAKPAGYEVNMRWPNAFISSSYPHPPEDYLVT